MSSNCATYAIAFSGSQPSSSCARCNAGKRAALRRSGGYLAIALAKPSSKRFCCSGEKGDGTGAALVPSGIIAARTNMALEAQCQDTASLQSAPPRREEREEKPLGGLEASGAPSTDDAYLQPKKTSRSSRLGSAL